MKRVGESTRLVIADDHPLFRGALREAVSGLFENGEFAEAGSFEEVVKLLERGLEIDLILLDLSMPGVRGFSGLMYLRAQYPSIPVIVVSANDDAAVIRRWDDGRVIAHQPLAGACERNFGAPYYHFHRAELLDVLSAAVPAACSS